MFKWSTALGGDLTNEQLDFARQEAFQNGNYDEFDRLNSVLQTRQSITDAMKTALDGAESSYLTDNERQKIKDAINAFGKPGEDNGVTVGIDDAKNEGAYTHVEDKNVIVAFNPLQINAANVAHEGVHVEQGLKFVKTGKSPNLFEAEKDAYMVGALTNVGLSNLDERQVKSYVATANNGVSTVIWGGSNFPNPLIGDFRQNVSTAKSKIATNVATHLSNNGITSTSEKGIRLAFPGSKGRWR